MRWAKELGIIPQKIQRYETREDLIQKKNETREDEFGKHMEINII